MSETRINLHERHNNDGNEYPYTVVLRFDDLQNHSEFEEPVEGVLEIDLSEKFPYPVEVNIKKDMMGGRNDDATYAEFNRLSQKVENPNKPPLEFKFITGSAPASEMHGSKVYSFRTNKYEPEENIPPKDDPEFIEHHIGIPSSKRVRLITNVGSRILSEEVDSDDIRKMIEVYDKNRSSSIEKFYEDIKTYGDFELQIKTMDFLMKIGDIYRDHSAVVNKVAKQIDKERLRRNVESLNDVKKFISVINSQEGLPDISLQEVWDEVYKRKNGNKEELNQVAEDLGEVNWNSLQ
jgi:hypothetical protein